MEAPITFVPWTDIKLFHNLVKFIEVAKRPLEEQKSPEDCETGDDDLDFRYVLKALESPVVFRGKVKLHGSNAGVALEGSQIRAQSRTQFIDRSGFGRIVFEKGNENYFRSLIDNSKHKKLTIFGEYCGAGVQKGVALSKLKNEIFAIFAIDIDSNLVVEPKDIENFMTKGGTIKMPSNVFVIPWHTEPIAMDLNLGESAYQSALDDIEEQVQKIDAIDPWAKEVFGIEGPGEGLVMYPVSLMETTETVPEFSTLKRNVFSVFGFKAKGEKHRVVASKKSVSAKAQVAPGVEAFANMMCPEPRLEQGAGEVGGFDMTKMKAFLDWVIKDVQKEGKDELEASKLEWKDVNPVITKKASTWYTAKVKALKQQ